MFTLFLFVKTIEKVSRLCNVLSILVVVLKIWAFLANFNIVVLGGGAVCAHNRQIDRNLLIPGAQVSERV